MFRPKIRKTENERISNYDLAAKENPVKFTALVGRYAEHGRAQKRHPNATTAVDSQCQNDGRRGEEGKANIDTTHCKHRTEDRSELLESVESPLWGEQQRVMELIVVCPIYPQTVTSGRWRSVWEK